MVGPHLLNALNTLVVSSRRGIKIPLLTGAHAEADRVGIRLDDVDSVCVFIGLANFIKSGSIMTQSWLTEEKESLATDVLTVVTRWKPNQVTKGLSPATRWQWDKWWAAAPPSPPPLPPLPSAIMSFFLSSCHGTPDPEGVQVEKKEEKRGLSVTFGVKRGLTCRKTVNSSTTQWAAWQINLEPKRKCKTKLGDHQGCQSANYLSLLGISAQWKGVVVGVIGGFWSIKIVETQNSNQGSGWWKEKKRRQWRKE